MTSFSRFKGEIKAYSDKYHKLWMDNKELSDDYDGILRVMADFLKCREGETAAGISRKMCSSRGWREF
jgi:hypothetical protein